MKWPTVRRRAAVPVSLLQAGAGKGRHRLVAGVAAVAFMAPASAVAAPPEIVDENGNSNGPSVPWPQGPEIEDNGSQPVPVVSTDSASTIPAGGSSCMWNVKGRLVVRSPTVDGLVDNDPLEDVEIKVSGRSQAGLYNEWNTNRTDENGDFLVPYIECSNRKVKIEARFKSDALHATSSASPDWYLLHETSGTIGPSTIDVKREPFGGETGAQSSTQARTDAQTWAVYERVTDYVAAIGHPLAGRVTAHNPATLTVGLSATDPILQEIHIDPNDTAELDTMLHEFGHRWMYPNVTGESCLTWDALASGSTHDAFELPCVAISEGFAEFFANKLEQEMNAAGLIASSESSSSTTPMNRAMLAQTYGLDNGTEMEQTDIGWEQVFRILTSSDITQQLFGEPDGTPGLVSTYSETQWSCAGNGQPVGQDDLADALQVIGDAQDRMDISTDPNPIPPLNVYDLLERAADRLSSFDDNDALDYLFITSPTGDAEGHAAYGC